MPKDKALPIISEIGRIIISLTLIVLAAFLSWCGWKCTEIDTSRAMVAMGSFIIGGLVTYWLAPRIPITNQ